MATQETYCSTPERLAAGALKRIEDARGLRITSLAGDLWVTQLGDETDYILGCGQSLLLEHDGSVLVSALGDAATVCLSPLPTLLLAA